MNIYHNILPIALALYILPGCSYSSDEEKSSVNHREEQCGYAMQGELDINTHKLDDPESNSYLLNCAIAIIVSLPNESKASVQNRTERKLKVADFLIAQNLDVNFKDETGTTLLMAAIISYMPRDWKLKAAEILLLKGIDIEAKNIYGKTAFDLAKFSGDSKMIDFLDERLR